MADLPEAESMQVGLDRLAAYIAKIDACERLFPTINHTELRWIVSQENIMRATTDPQPRTRILGCMSRLVEKTVHALGEVGHSSAVIGRACGVSGSRIAQMRASWARKLRDRLPWILDKKQYPQEPWERNVEPLTEYSWRFENPMAGHFDPTLYEIVDFEGKKIATVTDRAGAELLVSLLNQ